jgi:hypothetical protein
MASEYVGIKHVLRRMRGASQPFLVEGEDGHFYVAKFSGNPQGNRTLINEWITHRLFQQLGLSTPCLRILELTERTEGTEALCFQVGDHTKPIEGVFHLGSQCPVNPTTTAIYDFLPSKLLPKVVNLVDLRVAFVLDRWLGQTDGRQAIFVRDRTTRGNLELRLYLIDHGMSFAGKHWEFPDSPQYGLYMARGVYSVLNMKVLCEQALSGIDAFAESDLYAAADDIPISWFCEEDFDALAKLLRLLHLRRRRLRPIVLRHLEALQLESSVHLQQQASISGLEVVRQQPVPNFSLMPELC